MNEYEECVSMLKEGLKGRNLYQSVELLGRYYANELKLSNFEVYNHIVAYLKDNLEDYSEKKYHKMVEYYSINHKGNLSRIDHIDVCKSELDTIQALTSKNLRNLAVTLLCVAKFNHKVNPNNDYWCNLSIKQLSNISAVKEKTTKMCDYLHQLYKLGLIKFNRKVSSNSVNVLFAVEPKGNRKAILKVTSFDSLIKDYNLFLKTYL